MAEFGRELVLQAFEKFNEASASMETAYHRLAEQFRSLSKELEETNERLRRTVREKERIGSHLHAVLESLESGVLVSDTSGRITHKNAAAARLLFDGHAEFGERSALSDVVDARPELETVLDPDGPTRFETTIVRDGAEGCLQVERRDLAGRTEELRGAVFVIRDLTELRGLEHHAQQMERLAAMGEMALELAHEIRNPLGGIQLHVSLLEGDDELSEAGRGWLQQVHVGIRSLNNAVSNMLSFGRPQAPMRTWTDLRELVDETDGFLAPLTRERNVAVTVNSLTEDTFAPVDPDQIRQVLLNLWLNALNAMPSGGRLAFLLRLTHEGELEIEVSDSGPGLPPGVRDRVFDPFYTTDRRGTGLGLAVASQIIGQHGGNIRVDDESDHGATFRITLPKVEETCAVTF